MIWAWASPEERVNLRGEVQAKATSLHSAAERGARFLALPVNDIRDAVTWILAAFHSPLAVVPLPADLPELVLSQRLAQLPAGQVVFPRELSAPTNAPLPIARKPTQEIWAVIFTSGSSGVPKGIALSGGALQASAHAHAEHSRCGDATWLLDLPLFHVGGLSVLSRALFLHAAVALGSQRFHAETTANWIRSGKIQGISLVPTTLFRALDRCADFSPLKIILLGGAAAESTLVDQAIAKKAPVRLTYGMTEHSSQIATERAPRAGLEALPGVELKIAPDGEILVRSPCLAAGIYREGELLPLPLRDGFFATGDLGELRGKQLFFRGRKSEVIVSGGKKIFPGEVESAVSKLSGVKDCAVFGLPDPEWGEELCALVAEERSGAFNPAHAKATLAKILEAHQVPKRWLTVESIPRSPAGKILRGELRARLKSKPSRN